MLCFLILLGVAGFLYVRTYGWKLPSFHKNPTRNHPVGDPKPPRRPETPDDQIS